MDVKANAVWYSRELMGIYEAVFGREWLEDKVRRAQIRKGRFDHPMVEAYHQLQMVAEQARQVISAADLERILPASFFIRSLQAARSIPGHEYGLPLEKIRNAREWPAFECIGRIANLMVSAGFAVEYVPVSTETGVRTPDLRCTSGETEVFVEVKRKDRYIKVETGTSRTERFMDRIMAEHENLNLTVNILTIDQPHERMLPDITHAIGAFREHGSGGAQQYDSGFYISVEASRPWSSSIGMVGFLRTNNLRAGRIYGMHEQLPGGGTRMVHEFKLQVLGLDTAKIESVLNSAHTAIGQLAGYRQGYVALEVDSSQIPGEYLPMYFSLIRRSLHDRIRREDCANILGVILSFTPALYRSDGGVRFGGQIEVIYRDDAFPDKLSIPSPYHAGDLLPD